MSPQVFNWCRLAREGWFIWLLLGIALVLRIGGVTHGVSFHPDERHIISVTERMLREGDWNPRFFAYGSFPFYLHGFATIVFKPVWPWLGTYDGLFVVGRSIAVLCGVLTVFLTFHLGRFVSGARSVGFLAALLLALNVFHVQLSRFYTVDVVLTTISVGATLLFCRIARGGSRRDYSLAGLVMGLALATKISALSLLAPFLVAVGIERLSRKDWGSWRSYRGMVGALVLALLFLFLAAPYSLLDYQTFLRHNHEQIAMTRGDWRPPYTVQYAETAPYTYALEQMYRYTFGPFLGIVVLMGTVWLGFRQLRRLRPLECVLLAAIIPVFVLVAGLQVKFPRYLLPLYPLLCVCGALGLRALGEQLAALVRSARWAESMRVLPAAVVIVASAIYVSAFVGIYRQPHSYVAASEWIFEHVPPGARLLGVHWDDKLPLSLPGRSPHLMRYQYEGPEHELVVYEPESPAKLDRMATQLANHDFIILPTARTYGSIPRLPGEFPDTTRLFSALFRGELGYGLVQSFKVRPTVGSHVFNDDLADESFSVYDHPKVLVFRNIGRLSHREIARRITAEGTDAPLLTRAEMLRWDGPADDPPHSAPSSWWALVVWFLVVQLAAFTVAPFISALFPHAPDRGLGIAKPLGAFALTFVVWLLCWYGDVPTSGGVVGAVLLVGICGAHLFVLQRWGGWRCYFVCARPHLRTVELVFIGSFLLFAAIRACSPAIFWGEKPMDFTFLNYFTRLQTLPPGEPWVAGLPMGYYYLGFYLLGALHKVTGVDPAIGFNLAIATIAAWLIAALYSLGAWLTGARRGGLLIALGVALLSNWEVLRLAFFAGRAWNFDLFWASSRVLTSPAITEYPLWSLLFADLHAHVIALPFTVALIFTAFAPFKRSGCETSSRGLVESAVHGLILGSLFALNTWDFISGVGFSIVGVLLRVVLADRGRGWWTGVKVVGFDVLIIGLTAALVVIPFAVTSVKTEQIHWGWVRGEFAQLPQVVGHLGLWWLLLFIGSAGAIGRLVRGAFCRGGLLRIGFVLSVAAAPLGLAILASGAGVRGFSWGLVGMWSLLAGAASAVLIGAPERLERRLMGALALCGIALGVGAEFLFLMDRMNTIFKFYHFVWTALAVSSLALVYGAAQSAPSLGELWRGSWMKRASVGVISGGVVIAAIGTAINLWAMVPFQRVDSPRPTLNGQLYLERSNREDAPIIAWLRRNVTGLPTILEAWGESYGPYTRIAMHTGLPTVLGWEHHVRQRGASDDEVRRRKRDIMTVYHSTDIVQSLRILKRYGVTFVVVSALERATYPHEGLQKFDRYPQYFKVVQRTSTAALYRVVLPPGGVLDGIR